MLQPPSFRVLQELTASERKPTLSERPDPPPSTEDDDQLVLTDFSLVTEMLQALTCPHCNEHRLSMHVGRVMGYAVEMALTCDSCGRELDRRFSSRKMATDPNITRQPFRVNRRRCWQRTSIAMSTGAGGCRRWRRPRALLIN